MKSIEPTPADAVGFLDCISNAVDGALKLHRPAAYHVVAVQDYFDSKWLGFSGTVLGAVGVRGTLTTLPPFHPHRVVREQRFALAPSGAEYEIVSDFEPLHIEQPSARNLTRRAATLAPDTALFWYSSGSSVEGRGSLMVYMPVQEAYWKWYVAFTQGEPWRLARCSGISRAEVARLSELGSSAAEA